MDGQRSKPGPHLGRNHAMRFVHQLMPWDPAQLTQSWPHRRCWVLGDPRKGFGVPAPSVPEQRPKKTPCWLIFEVRRCRFNSQSWERYLLTCSILQEKGSKLTKGFTHFSHSGTRSLAFNGEEEGWKLGVTTRKECPEETG